MSTLSATGRTVHNRRMNDINHAVDAWLGDLARAGRSPATRLKYQQVLWLFAAFLEREGIRDCDRVTTDLCRRFLNKWVDSSPSTMALGVTVVRGFFAFLVDETVLEHSPAERIRRPKRKRPEELDVVTVTSSDVERMFLAALTTQEILCLAVLAYMGPRRTAASRARRRDVDLDKGTIRFLEKGAKVAVKPIPDELAAIIRAADNLRVWASPNDYLIPSRRDPRNRERSPKVIYDTVTRIAARAGVRSHVHALRAAFAVRMDEQNPGRLVAIKELLGHSRVETTMVYLRRQDKHREMETVRGLSWGSSPAGVGADVFPSNADAPPAGFEPALLPEGDEHRHAAVTDPGSLPPVLLAKLEALRTAGNEGSFTFTNEAAR